MIVDFAIVGDDPAAIGRVHWLVPLGGQVEDREATMAKAKPRLFVDPAAAIIRPAVNKCACQPFDQLEIARPSSDHSNDTAHQDWTPASASAHVQKTLDERFIQSGARQPCVEPHCPGTARSPAQFERAIRAQRRASTGLARLSCIGTALRERQSCEAASRNAAAEGSGSR